MPSLTRSRTVSDGLHSPRPLRRDNELGRTLLALDVPDCDCITPPVCRGTCRGGNPDCRIDSPCPCCLGKCDCPGLPCGCGAGSDHPLSLEEWSKLQLAFDPAGYSDPSPPHAPAQVLSRAARLAVYEERAAAGQHLYHPQDLRAEDADGACILAFPGRKQGGVAAQTRRAA